MTTRQWILVAAALGIGIVAQIPMDHAMDGTESGAGHEMASHDHAVDMAAGGEAMGAMADMPDGLAQVMLAITGMT